ncbi:MAG: A/G-specific adenine glycosylase, partial [Planctomycetes bacterium]|nr:A/G-specific adenine glycosylase [Planctomycetota bacterium]
MARARKHGARGARILAREAAPRLDPRFVRGLHRDLLAWFATARRPLPWRADRDPYRVWISEAMLQQTRVETVIPYFARFLARFPTVEALAEARVDDVLAAWSGLGYYRRARTLHATARALVERHGGAFPREREHVLDLPGIGPYTAGAVLSIAYDLPEALVDGNVARVFARLFEIDGAPGAKEFEERVWSLARELVPARGGAGDWNQALMELGALVCTPREPECGACPVRSACKALAAERVHELPRPKLRRAAVAVELVLLVDARRAGLLMEERPETGRMAGLWQLPTIELGARARIAPLEWPAGARVVLGDSMGELAHTITHHRFRAALRRGELGGRARPERWRRVRAEE